MAMTPKHFIGGLLLASVTGLSLAALPGTAEAGGPPFTPPGHAKKGGLPPGAQKFGHGGFCPPGLRDKGCVPPGLQKFHRGDRIPDWHRYDRLHYRDYGLRRPGPDERYIRIGRDAYLISEGTQRVLEAINLFDAVGR